MLASAAPLLAMFLRTSELKAWLWARDTQDPMKSEQQQSDLN